MGKMGALRWEKRVGCSDAPPGESATASLIVFERKSPVLIGFCQAPYHLFVKHVWWRPTSRWKQYLIRQRRCNASTRATVRYNYDLRSYAQNFDEGCYNLHDTRPRFAPSI